MPSASLVASGKANLNTDVRVGKNDVRVGRLSGDDARVGFYDIVMRRLRRSVPSKTALELSQITGRSVRTAERWLSGELTPDGQSAAALFLSDYSSSFFEDVTARLSPERQEKFWRDMGKASKRMELRFRQAALEKELAEIDSE